MDSNLPATRDEAASASDATRRAKPHRPVSVALVPLGLVTFVVIAFVMAAWTFLATAL